MELKFKQLEVKKIDAPHFTMSPFELKDYVDFEIKRFYIVTAPKGEFKTGAHCHKVEKELFVLVQGSCTAVIDQGNGLEEIQLEGMGSALYVGEYVWHSFKDLSADAILLAVSSTNYSPDRSDYIENYDEYKQALQTV